MQILRPEYLIELKGSDANSKADLFMRFITHGDWLMLQSKEIQFQGNQKDAWRTSLIKTINSSWVRKLIGLARSEKILFTAGNATRKLTFSAMCIQRDSKSMGALQLVKVEDENVIGNPAAARIGQDLVDAGLFDEAFVIT